MLYIWADGSVADNAQEHMSDDFFTIPDTATYEEVRDALTRNFGYGYQFEVTLATVLDYLDV
jgi:uncharacterized protein CbrC (UPF0167 family)